MSNMYLNVLDGTSGGSRSLSLAQFKNCLSYITSSQGEGVTLTDVATFTVNGGIVIVDDSHLDSSNINVEIGPGLKSGTALVAITATNKKISIFNQTGAKMLYYISSTQSAANNPLGYGKTFSAIAKNGGLIVSTPQVQMNGMTIDIRTAMTDTGEVNAYIGINITPLISQAFNPNTIVTTIGDSGYVNVTQTYVGYPIVIDNTSLHAPTTIAIDKSVVANNPTHLNITVKAGLQPVLVNNNTSYPATYSMTVSDEGIVSLYEGTVTAGQYIPGMTQNRFIEGEFIDISIQPIFSTQMDPNALLQIVGIQITGEVVILDAITKTNTIPPNISLVPVIDFAIDQQAQFATSTINGSNGQLLVDVTNAGTFIPTSIFTTSTLRSLAAINNSSTNVDLRYYNNDTALSTTFNADFPSTPYLQYYQNLYNAIYASPPTAEDVVLPPGQTVVLPTGFIPAETYISTIYYPPGYGPNNSTNGMLALFVTNNPDDAVYINYNISVSQGPITIATNTGFLNNFTNTQLLTLQGPNGNRDYTLVIDPSIVLAASSQQLPVNGFSGVMGIVDPVSITLDNRTAIPTIFLYDLVGGSSSAPTATTSGYTYIPPGGSAPVGVPSSGTAYFSFSLINAKSSFLVIYASVAPRSMYDPNNIIATNMSIDSDNTDISTTILTPLVQTSPIVSLVPSTLSTTLNPFTLYVDGLNSLIQLENQTGVPLTISNNGVSAQVNNGQILPVPILFGVFAFAVSGDTVTINNAAGTPTIVTNSTLFVNNGAFTPTVSQLGGYINLQYGNATTGSFVIPAGIPNYTPFILQNTQQQQLSFTNNTGAPLTLDLAIYTVSNASSNIAVTVQPGGTYNLGKPIEAAVYYHDNTLSGIIVL